MFSFFAKKTKITLYLSAAEKISDAAKNSYPKETGGILLGWWEKDEIIVIDVLEVKDPDATAVSWTRYQEKAQVVLEQALEQLSNDKVGYVGDWHSHPEHCGASSVDIESEARASRQYDKPLALLISLPDKKIYAYSVKKGKKMSKTVLNIKEKNHAR